MVEKVVRAFTTLCFCQTLLNPVAHVDGFGFFCLTIRQLLAIALVVVRLDRGGGLGVAGFGEDGAEHGISGC